MNHVSLYGQLAADPRTIERPVGPPLTLLRIAVRRARPGREHASADFVTVESWGALASVAANELTIGQPVAITGRLRQRLRSDEHGTKTDRLTIVADWIDFPPRRMTQTPAVPATAPIAA